MIRQTRREFLEHSMLAAAAAAGASLAAPAFAAGESSPNEKIRLALIGGGDRGREHLNALAKFDDIELAVICDADEARCREKCDLYETKLNKPRPTFVQDIRRLLDDKSIQAVSIATPNHWHSLAAIWAMQAGKDVYVEKPVSHTVIEGRRMVDAARKHNRICQSGTQGRTSAALQQLIKFIHEGGIGDVRLARALCYKPRKSIGPRGEYEVPASVDYNLWAGPAPMTKPTRQRFHYDWHWQWDYGDGDLGNQGIHQMDQARWGLGIDGLAKNVFSYGGRLGYEDAGETANTQVSVYDFGDKTIVFEVRGLDTPEYQGAKIGVIFYGTKGHAVAANGGGVLAFDLDGKPLPSFTPPAREARNAGGEGGHFANFFAAIRSRDRSKLNAEILEGHLSSALCHLGNISYRLGQPVGAGEVEQRLAGNTKVKDECLATFDRVKEHLKANNVDLEKAKLQFGAQLAFDSKSETFNGAGSDKANVLLTREYRKGFEVPASADKV